MGSKGLLPSSCWRDREEIYGANLVFGNASFQNLLKKAEEEFDVDHQIGAIKLPCDEHSFLALMSTHISLFILSTI